MRAQPDVGAIHRHRYIYYGIGLLADNADTIQRGRCIAFASPELRSLNRGRMTTGQ